MLTRPQSPAGLRPQEPLTSCLRSLCATTEEEIPVRYMGLSSGIYGRVESMKFP